VLVRFDHVASVIINANHGIAPEGVSWCEPMKPMVREGNNYVTFK
jgi:hypothetical protein